MVTHCTCILQVMDELVPKATGYEARIEKRRMMNQRRRERETSPGMLSGVLNNDVHRL